MHNNTFAHTCWTPGDVQTLAPRLSDAQAVEWLERNEKFIQDAMVERGWAAMEAFLHMDGIDCRPVEE